MSDIHDPWAGMRPMLPPGELRARVLAAAREAAAMPPPSLLAALYRDRLLRLCAAGLAALVIANLLVAGGGRAPASIASPSVVSADGVAIPADGGLTAAEQLDRLGPELGDAFERSRV